MNNVKIINRIDTASFNHFVKSRSQLKKGIEETDLAIRVELNLKNVKKGEDITYRIDKNADLPTQIITKIANPNDTHKYRMKDIIRIINNKYSKIILNQFNFRAIRQTEKIDSDDLLTYFHTSSKTRTYSQKCLDIIIKNIDEIPNYLEICCNNFKM